MGLQQLGLMTGILFTLGIHCNFEKLITVTFVMLTSKPGAFYMLSQNYVSGLQFQPCNNILE